MYHLPKKSFNKIAFDLDDTLAEGTWPSPAIGHINEHAKDALLFYHGYGFSIVIFTSRPASHALRIWDWLDENGLKGCVYDVITDKPHYDDRAFNYPEGIENERKTRRLFESVP